MGGMYGDVVEWVGGADTDALLSQLAAAEERRRAAEAELAVIVNELEERKVHRPEHASMYGVLRSRVGWSDVESRDRLRLGRLFATFSDAGELLYDGRASVANMIEIARGYANPRCGEEIEFDLGSLLTAACRKEHDDLRRDVQAWEQRVDHKHAEDAAAHQHELRDARMVNTGEGAELKGKWGELDGLMIREVLDQFTQMEWQTDWDATVEQYGENASPVLMPRTAAQRRADAVTAIFQRAASTPPGAKAPKPLVVIHTDHATATDILTEMGILPERDVDPFEHGRPVTTDRRCETTDGLPVDPRTAIRVALAGHIRWAIHDEAGVPIRWGRRRRLFTGAAADAVRSTSTRCTFPGCRVPAGRCDLDHIRPFGRGGRTDPDNGGPLCDRHNQLKNRGYTTWRDPTGTWHAYRPDGTELPWY
jgi:hypothetical protein